MCFVVIDTHVDVVHNLHVNHECYFDMCLENVVHQVWPDDISAFLCNILEANNVKPKRVLRAKNLPTNDMQDAFAIQALFEAAAPYMPETVASDTDASGTDHSSIDSHVSDASDD